MMKRRRSIQAFALAGFSLALLLGNLSLLSPAGPRIRTRPKLPLPKEPIPTPPSSPTPPPPHKDRGPNTGATAILRPRFRG